MVKDSLSAAAAAFDPVRPIRTPAPYIGGKRNLSGPLAAMIDADEHDLYVEPFVGMGGVFFKRTRMAKCEVINDISRDVICLFRILARHYKPFVEMLEWHVGSRAEFDRLMAVDPDTCTDLERAARFLYLQKMTFGGKVAGRSYGTVYDAPSRFRLSDIEPTLRDLHDRLERVHIECQHYERLIQRFDRPGALFYIDPPYWNNEGDYGAGVFGREDFERLADLLAALKGRFILSINDTPGVREVFERFAIGEIDTTWTVGTSHGGGKRVTELIITGT
jgi:DNA adenine methylase